MLCRNTPYTRYKVRASPAHRMPKGYSGRQQRPKAINAICFVIVHATAHYYVLSVVRCLLRFCPPPCVSRTAIFIDIMVTWVAPPRVRRHLGDGHESQRSAEWYSARTQNSCTSASVACVYLYSLCCTRGNTPVDGRLLAD